MFLLSSLMRVKAPAVHTTPCWLQQRAGFFCRGFHWSQHSITHLLFLLSFIRSKAQTSGEIMSVYFDKEAKLLCQQPARWRSVGSLSVNADVLLLSSSRETSAAAESSRGGRGSVLPRLSSKGISPGAPE
ncbi:unnamed protein product [Pleuronectes platessa]|uniref:Uncharacterized protein n=1 Tax=Pleuronectes platessa TaxID=8262 RepID=A0A9N7YT75_PLEPL|nr:unnamed protein product [Pleuronectes platessa]